MGFLTEASLESSEALARRLLAMTSDSGREGSLPIPGVMVASASVAIQEADAIITHAEVNEKHGVGVLLKRLFQREPNILCIRSQDMYEGAHELGGAALRITHSIPSRDAVFSRVLDALGPATVKRVLCVPYFPDDVRTAVAVKEIFGVPMCTYLMDDQNICADGIPDELMRELLAKSALRLGISPELCTIYGLKYGHRIWYMPPVVPHEFIAPRLNVPSSARNRREGVIIGNIWGRQWLQRLRSTVRDSGITLTWYCSGEFRWLACSKEALVADSIIPQAPLPVEELIRTVRQAWFAVVPSGTIDEADDRRFIAQLSLPSRIPFLMATAHLPILVLGHPDSGAARFVEQFGIGLTADYDRQAFIKAVDRLSEPELNLALRRRALALAGRFSDAGATEWIWQSLARREPLDRRYEELMPDPPRDLTHLL